MEKRYMEFIVYSTTVLIAKLAYDLVMRILPVIKSTKNPYLDVLIGMSLTVILFIPMYDVVHNAIERQVEFYIKTSKKYHKNRYVGMTLAYMTLLLILFGLFMEVKFNINIIAEAFKGLLKLLHIKVK